MNANVIGAIFRRNFISYFSNPTGYVFICVFVLASSFAAFWPADFFNANLANLDQLNKFLPYILIAFIPAITMSIWADERRQGTDELLLTIPAGDFDVVLGKYLAAVAIYTVSLLFSLVSNSLVLMTLGEPDFGLICGTYFGYWIVGLAMLGIGMVASFLTGNLTVAFILGVVLNAPLVFLAYSEALSSDAGWASFLKRWSLAEQFRDFSRGVISISSLGYFLGLTALMLYLSMVLIGRRHWKGGVEGQGTRVHYFVRFLALLAIVLGGNMVLARNDRVRFDVTTEKLSSLSPETRKLLANLDPKYPITVDAYVSPTVPESYAPTRLNLLATLREFQAISGGKIKVNIHDTEPSSQEGSRAETQFGIRPQTVMAVSRGVGRPEEIFLGVAFTRGVEKVVVPFLDKGIPVEYELVRSVATVSSPKRKKLGILTTDAKMFGGFDMGSMQSTQDQLIVGELKKQYDVVQVDPANPIKDRYDVLLAVQPSSLDPAGMTNFVECVKSGQPTAIFEDPFPFFAAMNGENVVGTAAPKQPQGGANPFMQRQPPGPKGKIELLWNALGVDFTGNEVVWQDYLPYPQYTFMTPEWVFAGPGSNAKDPFNEKSEISSKLQQLLFVFPGAIRGQNATTLKFESLVSTNKDTGTVPADKIMERNFMGQGQLNPDLKSIEKATDEQYHLAAKITGKLKAEVQPMSDEEAAPPAAEAKKPEAAPTADADQPVGEPKKPAPEPKSSEPAKPADSEINVVVITDIDCLYSQFFMVRARGSEDDGSPDLSFDNVTFILNTLDSLAGDTRFVEIRKRRPMHRTLTQVSIATENARQEALGARQKYQAEYDAAVAAEQKKMEDAIAKVRKEKGDRQAVGQAVAMAAQDGQRRLDTKLAQLQQQSTRDKKQIDRNLALEVRKVQDRYKTWAIILPPIPPLLLGLFVFFNRRAKEREGVNKARLR